MFNTGVKLMSKEPLSFAVNKRHTGASIPSSLAKTYAEIIKAKIKQGIATNAQYESLFAKLIDPAYKEHIEFLKEEIRSFSRGLSHPDAQAYLGWLETNYEKIAKTTIGSRFEEETIDLYIRDEAGEKYHIHRELTIAGEVTEEAGVKIANVTHLPNEIGFFKQATDHIQKITDKGIKSVTVVEKGASVRSVCDEIGNIDFSAPDNRDFKPI